MLPPNAGKEILSLLLDKYENSLSFRNGTPPSRRIRLRLYDSGLSDYKRYNIENPEARKEVNRAVMELVQKGLARVHWMKGDENHIIAQVSLNTDGSCLEAAYAFLGRTPKNIAAQRLAEEVRGLLLRVKTPWIRGFLEDCLQSLEQKHAAGRLPADGAERENLFRALSSIDSQPEGAEILERVFSTRCFGNSKTFELSVKKRLLEIIRRYSDSEDDSGDEELLAFAGIFRYPESFEFRGGLSIGFEGGGRLDFSPLRHGAALSALDFASGRLEISQRVSRLLTIENKAAYISYIRQNDSASELIVYHGGQYSPSRGAFFKALAAALPENCRWEHWGDIDYGGFSMLARLRREILPAVHPFRMDEQELSSRENRAIPITDAYALRLQTLTRRPELSDCLPCIAFMLKRRVKMEQEALLDPPGRQAAVESAGGAGLRRQ
ncbi:MAG: DUF2220 domain-containing protein [Spirochaetaceae bacterium]|nr:DUF2220 domain-containing protein [Spirochaetaceae bacterium]